MLSARSPIAIYRALICLKEAFSQDEEARIIGVFQTSFPCRASYEETSQGRKYHLLMISSSPDNTTCTCNVCLHKVWKELSKRFHQFARLPYKVLRRKAFCENASSDIFGWERFMIYVELLDAWKIYFRKIG